MQSSIYFQSWDICKLGRSFGVQTANKLQFLTFNEAFGDLSSKQMKRHFHQYLLLLLLICSRLWRENRVPITKLMQITSHQTLMNFQSPYKWLGYIPGCIFMALLADLCWQNAHLQSSRFRDHFISSINRFYSDKLPQEHLVIGNRKWQTALNSFELVIISSQSNYMFEFKL